MCDLRSPKSTGEVIYTYHERNLPERGQVYHTGDVISVSDKSARIQGGGGIGVMRDGGNFHALIESVGFLDDELCEFLRFPSIHEKWRPPY
jgi:hypothetical protein